MKTEPTEALKSLSNIMMEDESSFISDETAYNLIHKAFAEGQSSPKIKQLEWEESPFFKGDYEAKFGLGKYFIDDCGGCITLVCPNQSLKHKFSTIEEAKAVAQADFEQRVKECLE